MIPAMHSRISSRLPLAVFLAGLAAAATGCGSNAKTAGPVAEAQSPSPKRNLDLTLQTPATTTPSSSIESDAQRFASEARYFIEHDLFIAADDPKVVLAGEVDFLTDDAEVLGFLVDGEARAYDVRALSYHHVVNDTIGDTPIAVTY